jgi:excisionase family DNA binding protein
MRHEKMTISTEFAQALLTAEEAAKVLNISSRHLFNLRKSGRIAAVRFGRSVRFHRDTLSEFARQGAAA